MRTGTCVTKSVSVCFLLTHLLALTAFPSFDCTCSLMLWFFLLTRNEDDGDQEQSCLVPRRLMYLTGSFSFLASLKWIDDGPSGSAH